MKTLWLTSAILASCIRAVTINEIQGPSFRSPLVGENVKDVPGIVTAKDRYGFWIQGEPSTDLRESSGLRVYGPRIAQQVFVGDSVLVSGRVSEYRDKPDELYLTEINPPSNLVVLSSNNEVHPIILGNTNNVTHRKPPLVSFTYLDSGPDGWLSVPGNASLLESVNATLQPDKYGLDFWESLEGQLVTVPNPIALNFPDRFGSFWVHGDWEVNGKNHRGGLSLTFVGSEGLPDAHPETILIGRPVDGTRNPKTVMGAKLADITGVVSYQFGHYYILPLTAPSVLSQPDPEVAPTTLYSGEHPCQITIGDYNVENMSPRSQHITRIADHIVNHLHSPDIVFVQEIQDDSGSRDDGTVSANKTLSALVRAISKEQKIVSGDHWEYQYVDIDPENNQDGGIDGGNIRVAYLWRPDKISLIPGFKRGGAHDAVKVVDDHGKLTISPNPGRVEPTSLAWDVTRKPLAAGWQTTTGERFFTVNVHFSSKRDSSSPHGDARPPVNGHSDRRTEQVDVVAGFVEALLVKNVNTSIVVAGDMNEFVQTRSVFRSFNTILTDINESSGVDPVERYTYVYDQNTQEIDQIFISDAISQRATKVEHVHLNTWATSYSDRASDHDPTVAKIWVCDLDVDEGELDQPQSNAQVVLEAI